MKPLEGILVLDFCQYLAGPSAALRLADLGARVIKIERPGTGDGSRHLVLEGCVADGDGLNFLAGKDVDFIRTQAMDGTLLAHVEGGVPNITLYTGGLDEGVMGQLIYFFEYACGLSGYLPDGNPFDQPGVEAYKKNMFALLGKPGYEELHETLLAKLGR